MQLDVRASHAGGGLTEPAFVVRRFSNPREVHGGSPVASADLGRDLGCWYHVTGASRSSLGEPNVAIRCLTSSSWAVARYRRVAGLCGEGQHGVVNGGVVSGVDSTECRHGEVGRNTVPRSLCELCQQSVRQTATYVRGGITYSWRF
jgi:hypothetical protein